MDLGTTSVLGFDRLLVSAATWLLGAVTVWLGALVLAVVVEAASDGRWRPARWTGAPPAWRRALLAAVVGLLTAVGYSPAHADSAERAGLAAAVEGLPLPTRPAGAMPAPRATVVVTPGDCLWSIAERHDPSARESDVVRLVQRIHRLNAEAIGPDPDRLLPGQRLVLPVPSHLEES